MQERGGQGTRERITQQVELLRTTLRQETRGDAPLVTSLTPDQLDKLVAAGGGTLTCLLLMLSPQERVAAELTSPIARRDEQMLEVTVRLVAPMVRKSDLLVRAGVTELACLLPATGPLEARTVWRRLVAGAQGQVFWVGDQRYHLKLTVGLSSRSSSGDFAALCDAARRNLLT